MIQIGLLNQICEENKLWVRQKKADMCKHSRDGLWLEEVALEQYGKWNFSCSLYSLHEAFWFLEAPTWPWFLSFYQQEFLSSVPSSHARDCSGNMPYEMDDSGSREKITGGFWVWGIRENSVKGWSGLVKGQSNIPFFSASFSLYLPQKFEIQWIGFNKYRLLL